MKNSFGSFYGMLIDVKGLFSRSWYDSENDAVYIDFKNLIIVK